MSVAVGLVAAAAYVAGWYYLFYSPAVRRMAAVEPPSDNRRRARLRRANGVALVLLATLFYVGFAGVNPDRRPRTFVVVWMAVFVLLGVVVLLAGIDMRMTARLRRQRRAGGVEVKPLSNPEDAS